MPSLFDWSAVCVVVVIVLIAINHLPPPDRGVLV